VRIVPAWSLSIVASGGRTVPSKGDTLIATPPDREFVSIGSMVRVSEDTCKSKRMEESK
jgi:hypothetical protein